MSSLEAAVFVAKRFPDPQAEVDGHYSGFMGKVRLLFRYVTGKKGYRMRQRREVGAAASSNEAVGRNMT
jgi:hypothetical protein